MNDIEGFVDRLIEEKGLEGLDPQVLLELKKDLVGRVEDRVNAAILAAMPPAKLEDFNKVLGQGDERAIQDFCKNNIPNLEALLAAELLNFRQTYLG